MDTIESWDIALLLVVGYLAAAALVRLMARHRDELVQRFRRELEQEKRHQANDRRGQDSQSRAG